MVFSATLYKVRTHGRFVEDEEFRLVQESDRERGATLLPAAHVLERSGLAREIQELHQEVDTFWNSVHLCSGPRQ